MAETKSLVFFSSFNVGWKSLSTDIVQRGEDVMLDSKIKDFTNNGSCLSIRMLITF